MKTWIVFSISCLSIVLSLIAIGAVMPSVGELNFDYYGAIVGVITLLFAILMGYQIYTVINVKEELKEIRVARAEIEQKLSNQKAIITEEYKEELEHASPLLLSLASKDMDKMLTQSFKAFARSREDSWVRNFSRQSLILGLLGTKAVDKSLHDKLINDIASQLSDKDVVAFYNDVLKRSEEDKSKNEPELKAVLKDLLSRIKTSANGEETSE